MRRPDNENRMALVVGCALLFIVMVSIVQLGVAVHTLEPAEPAEPNTPSHLIDQGGFEPQENDR